MFHDPLYHEQIFVPKIAEFYAAQGRTSSRKFIEINKALVQRRRSIEKLPGRIMR